MHKYGIQGHGTILGWLRKFGNFDRELYVKAMNKTKTPEQENFELKQQIKLLEKQKAFMARELELRDQKAIMFDAIVQVVKEDYNIDLLKKVTPERCVSTLKKRAKVKKLDIASEVISLVDNIRIEMPRIGTSKLHYLLSSDLESLGVGRDKFFRILKANQRLIIPKRCYIVTTNSHHRFRKHKDIVSETLIDRPEQVWVSDITYIGSRGS